MVNVAWILLEKFTMILFFLDDGLVGKTINDCKVIGGMKDIQVLREKIFKYLYCYWQQQASRRTHNTSTRNRI